MATLKNLLARELLVPLDRKRHFKLAPAGDPGDTRVLEDRHLAEDQRTGKVIEQMALRGDLLVVPGSQGLSISSIAVGQEQWPGLQGLDQVIDLEGAPGVDVAFSPSIPATAMLLSVQANIEELVVAGGTSTAVGIGIGAGDPDKYGLSADLLLNTKTDFFFSPPLAALGGIEVLNISMVTGAGAAGDTPAVSGKVRVRATWIDAPSSLPDAS